MTIENIIINGQLMQQTIMPIKGDDLIRFCLFTSLFFMYGNEEKEFYMSQ